MYIYDGKNDISNFESDKFLNINSSGISNNAPGYRVIREKGRVDYHVIFVKDGMCNAVYDEKLYRLKKGNIIIYPPNKKHEYFFEENCTTLWTHFAGTAVKEIFESLGLGFGVFEVEYNPHIYNTFLQLVYCTNQPEKQKFAAARLHMLMTHIAQALTDLHTVSSQAVSEAVSYISVNYDKNLSLSSLAASACLSKSRFSHLFSQITGTTPKKYQQELRLSCAAELLESTTLSVGEIAEKVGYPDRLYFSRIFKLKYGVSPSNYRKN